MSTPPSAFDRLSSAPYLVRQPSSSSDSPADSSAPGNTATTTSVAKAAAPSVVANGQDVTSTSPSASSFVSMRPLPSPNLYRPSLVSTDTTSVTTSAPQYQHHQFSSLSTSTSTDHSSSPSPSPAPSVISVASGGGNNSNSCKSKSSSSSSSNPKGDNKKENTGRWSTEEHEMFLKGLDEHGKQWKKIAVMIKTRSVVQVRTHAQKYFQKLLKAEKKSSGDISKISTSTATSGPTTPTTPSSPVKRKSISIKKTNAPSIPATMNPTKRRKVSLEPKKQPQSLLAATAMQAQRLTSAASYRPSSNDNNDAEHVVDPNFMNTLQMAAADGELDDSL